MKKKLKEFIKGMLECFKRHKLSYPFYLLVMIPFAFCIFLPVCVLAELFSEWNDLNHEWSETFRDWIL